MIGVDWLLQREKLKQIEIDKNKALLVLINGLQLEEM
jgi:hypothetical protein